MLSANASSMLAWWPVCRDLAERGIIKVPRTELALVENADLWAILDGETGAGFDDLVQRCKDAIARLGLGYPVFMRTDQTSNKHDWVRSCYLESEDRLVPQMCNLIEFSAMAGFIGLPVNAFAFREFLPLNYNFKAFAGMPIGREFRLFVRDGKVEHVQFYWPESSILNPDCEDWQGKFGLLAATTEDEQAHLRIMAEQVGAAIGDYWSIDFSQHSNGDWYLTDMARGEESFDTRDPGPKYIDFGTPPLDPETALTKDTQP